MRKFRKDDTVYPTELYRQTFPKNNDTVTHGVIISDMKEPDKVRIRWEGRKSAITLPISFVQHNRPEPMNALSSSREMHLSSYPA